MVRILQLLLLFALTFECAAPPYLQHRRKAFQGGATTDPYFANVTLLLHGNGTDGSTTFTDSSSYARTWTAVGNAQIDTAQSKFGGASGLFDGTGDYLTATSDSNLQIGSGDFTVEYWIRFSSSTAERFILVWGVSSYFGMTPSTGNVRLWVGSNQLTAGATAFNVDQWYHIAWVRSGTTLKVYRDGVEYASATTSATVGASSGTCYFASDSASSTAGWIDDFRITKGVARYTANFTPHTSQHPDQ